MICKYILTFMKNMVIKMELRKIILLCMIIASGAAGAGAVVSETAVLQKQSSSKTHINISLYAKQYSDTFVSSDKKDVWKYFSNKMQLDIPDNLFIQKARAPFLENKYALNSLLTRAEPYIYLIIDELKRRDMPVELLLIPMIESAFTTTSRSTQKAEGLWQIMPATAKRFNNHSENTETFDPRLDIIESTNIALNMFESINTLFNGDWLLTFAAYNSGEGRVLRAIKNNKAKGLPTNYWALDLPKETKKYVPKILALADLIKNHKKYNVDLPEFDIKNALTKLDLKKSFELSRIAKLSDIDLKTLKSYNAGYLTDKSTKKGAHYLIVKLKDLNAVHNTLVNNGFSETQIIERKNLFNHIPVKSHKDSARSVNNIAKTNKLYKSAAHSYVMNAAKNKAKTDKEKNVIHYKVKKGDSLIAIARKHKVKIHDLKTWNHLTNNTIKIGKTLKIINNHKST